MISHRALPAVCSAYIEHVGAGPRDISVEMDIALGGFTA